MNLLQVIAGLIHLPSENSPAGALSWNGVLRGIRIFVMAALSYIAVATLNAMIGDVSGLTILDEQTKMLVTMALTAALEWVRQWTTDYTKA